MEVMRSNTAERVCKIVRTALSPPTSSPKLAFLLDGVFSEEECQRLIEATERLGYGIALLNTGPGMQEHAPGYRDSARVMADDVAFAALLLDRIIAPLPERFHGSPLRCLNERMRFLRYDPGDKFKAHFDGCFSRPGETSMITIQLYLNGGFEGGATTFLGSGHADDLPVVPQPGRVLVFEHRILHEGSKLISGRKYALRTDAMYATSKD